MSECQKCGRNYDHKRMMKVANGKWNASRYCSPACYYAAVSAEESANTQARAEWDAKSDDEKIRLHVKAELTNRKVWTFLVFVMSSVGVLSLFHSDDTVGWRLLIVGLLMLIAIKFYLIIGQVARCIVIAALSAAIMAGIGWLIAVLLLSDASSVARYIAIFGCAAVGLVAGIPVGWKFRATAGPDETNVANNKKTHASDWFH